MERSRLPPSGLILLGVIALGWGFSWPVIKIVLSEIAPLTFRTACLLGGGGGLLLLARLAGQPVGVPVRHWSRLFALSATSIIGWNLFVVYGIARLPSGRAALLAYTMPLWGTLFSVWLLGDRLTARRALSLVLGMAGVATLLAPDLAGMTSAVLGVVLMLAAAISWALSIVLLKRFALPIPTSVLTAWTLIIGGVPIAGAAIVLEHDRWHPVTARAGLALTYSVVIAFMFCYWAWNRLVLMVPVAVSSISSLVTPVVGVLGGIWLLGEPLTWREVTAGACILGALALVLGARGPAANRAPT